MARGFNDVRVDGQRLWDSLMRMAEFGAIPKGGCNRETLTDDDAKARRSFIESCREIGCIIQVDRIGNIFARREGRSNELPPVLIGSHLDTQPTGGRFDGVFGVLSGLEVLRTLESRGIQTDHPIEVVNWTNEEGSRFPPAMMGSGVWAGVFDLDEIYATADKAGRRVGEELKRIGFMGDLPAKSRPLKAAFEIHIEQGPILEAAGVSIGVVTGIQGLRWYDLTITGKACHAGPTPMSARRDPFMAAGPILRGCYALAERFAPWGRVKFGDIRAKPGSRNTVPERLEISVDMRHPDAATLDTMDAEFRKLVESECSARNLGSEVSELWHMPATQFDRSCIEVVRAAAQALGYSHMEMVSGAGHDSLYVARVAPTSMIFVPCKDGLSHNEEEHASLEDLERGANVLLQSVLSVAVAA